MADTVYDKEKFVLITETKDGSRWRLSIVDGRLLTEKSLIKRCTKKLDYWYPTTSIPFFLFEYVEILMNDWRKKQ